MKNMIVWLLNAVVLVFAGCKPSPDKYFGIAALNCNHLFGFAGAGMERELQSPSEKLINETTYETAPMTRAEVVDTKLEIIRDNYEKVKSLPKHDEAMEMIRASLALYEFVLPVYNNEYRQLASLYDKGAASDRITALEQNIRDKYGAEFEKLYNAVISSGTSYATSHGIKVQTVNTSPPGAR